ncbi:hypothetical protein L3W35_RS27300, partial [Escherichia coli]
KKAAQLRRVITVGYYSPAEKLITSRFVVYSLLPASHHAGFFYIQKSPSGEGLTLRICIIMRMVPGASR